MVVRVLRCWTLTNFPILLPAPDFLMTYYNIIWRKRVSLVCPEGIALMRTASTYLNVRLQKLKNEGVSLNCFTRCWINNRLCRLWKNTFFSSTGTCSSIVSVTVDKRGVLSKIWCISCSVRYTWLRKLLDSATLRTNKYTQIICLQTSFFDFNPCGQLHDGSLQM